MIQENDRSHSSTVLSNHFGPSLTIVSIQGKVLSHLSVLLFAYKSSKGEENLNPKNAIFGTIELLKPIAKLSMSDVVKCKLLAIKVSL